MQSNQILIVATVVLALVAAASAQLPNVAVATGSGITAAGINVGGGVTLTTTRGAFTFMITKIEEFNASNPTVALRTATIPLTTVFVASSVNDITSFGVLGSSFSLTAANINLVGGANTTNSSTIVNYGATVFKNDTAISAGVSVAAPPGVAANAQSSFRITNGSAIVQVGLTTFNSFFGNGNTNIRITVTVAPSTGRSTTSGTVASFQAANANVAPARTVLQGPPLLPTTANAGLTLNGNGPNGLVTYTVSFQATNANNQAYFFFGAGQNNFNGAASLLSSVWVDSVKALF